MGTTLERTRRVLGTIALSAVIGSSLASAPPARAAATLLVPEQYATISAAITAAVNGDVIDVAPGVYAGAITLNKSITIRGRAPDPVDPRNNTTILDGVGLSVTPITVGTNVLPGPTLTGLVFRAGDNGVAAKSPVTIAGSWFTGNIDHIDLGLGGGGWIHHNVFEGSLDDSVDLDHLVRNVTVEHNRMVNSQDDGIEMRLHDDVIATTAVATYRDNEITGSRGDGIQIIDYYTDTNRRIVIERNLIHDVARAAIGLLDNEVTVEDYRAASIRERIEVVHNTLLRNNHGISGGDNLVAINNVLVGHAVGMKNVDGGSIASRNLFWNNTTDTVGSNVEFATVGDPLLGPGSVPQAGSPAIDAGWASFSWGGGVVTDQAPGSYGGTAPDLGWVETQDTSSNTAPTVGAGPDQTITLPAGASLAGSATDDGLPNGALQTGWSKVSGAGTVNFADAGSPTTTATFDRAGPYVLRLTADDGALSSLDEVTITVLAPDPGNRPPVVDSVSITPTAPRTNDVLTATASATDPDGDQLTLAYTWTRNGTVIAGQTGATLALATAGNGDEGDEITVAVLASDGAASSSPLAASPVTIQDTPPAFSQNLGDRSDQEGAAVSLSAAATDADGEAIAYTATGLPPGVSIDTSTGAISGTIASGAAALSPYAVAITLVQGAVQGPTDTFAWTVTAAPPPAGITFRGVSTAAGTGKSAISVTRPAGVAIGDALLASVLVAGAGSVTAPSGWAPVRDDLRGTVARQFMFVRVAQASEATSYRFTLSPAANVTVIIAAYEGVDPVRPVVTSSGLGTANTTSIVAPSVENPAAGAMLVGCFGIVPTLTASITPPPGMTERAEAGTGGKPRPRLAVTDQVLPATGATGSRTAISNRLGPAIGQLVLLRPA